MWSLGKSIGPNIMLNNYNMPFQRRILALKICELHTVTISLFGGQDGDEGNIVLYL